MIPTQKDIYAWKARYGTVLKKTLEDRDVYYRLLTCREMALLVGREELSVGIVPDLVILNDVSLKLPGSRVSLTEDVLKRSGIGDEDDLKKTAIENRNLIADSFQLNLIQRICGVFMAYTPDMLLDKTTKQLLEIAALAESVTGQHIIITGDEPKMPPGRVPNLRKGGQWTKPKTDELMEDSVSALKTAMGKYGKQAPTLKEKKKTDPLSSQMEELNKFVK